MSTKVTKPGLFSCPSDDHADRDRGKASGWRSQLREDPSVWTSSSNTAHIGSDCASDVMRQRQAILPSALASDDEFASIPIDVVQGQRRDFARSETKANQDENDCERAHSPGRPTVAPAEETPHVARRQPLRKRGQPPARYRWRRSGEVTCKRAPNVQEPQQRAERGHLELCYADAAAPGLGHRERRDVGSNKTFEPKRL
jgi:hypothetical protein